MRIAIIGSFGSEVPLREGQIHAPLLLSYNLAIELAKMDHEVTYFGSYDEKRVTKLSNLRYTNINYKPIPDGSKEQISSEEIWHQLRLVYEQGYVSKILAIDGFDLFYSWSAYRIGSLARITKKPVVVTHHDSTNLVAYNLMFKSFVSNNLFMIPISKYMDEKILDVKKLATVYNGVNTDQIHFRPLPENYFCWLGRVAPSKGLHIAIKLAKKMNFKLKYAGPISRSFGDFGDVGNYSDYITKETENSENIEYLGVLDQQSSYNLISESKGLIFPTDGMESFSMITAESICAGVPVIAFNKGPLPELVDQGKTGFLCETMSDMETAIKNINKIDRSKCREIGVKRFSQKVMAENYLEQFLVAIESLKRKNEGKN